MNSILTKNALSPVISILLLLLISVTLFTIVFNFTNDFVRDSEGIVENSNSGEGELFRIVENNDTSVFMQNIGRNLSINRVSVGGVDCNIEGNFTEEFFNLDISSCIDSSLSSTPQIRIESEEGFYEGTLRLSSALQEACVQDGVIVYNGNSREFFSEPDGSGVCTSEVRTCDDGNLEGNSQYQYRNCNNESVSSQDTLPDAFSFTDQSDVSTSTVITSNTETPTGYDGPLNVSVSGDGSPELRLLTENNIGEAGSFSVSNNDNVIINFTQSYSQPPALFMTPKTDNAGIEAPFAPIIHSINTTHANVSLCQDNGATTCETTYGLEEVSYMAFDVNKTNNLSWIEVGFINASTDGSTTTISFTKTFSNTPYMFGQPQTYNIGSVVTNGIGAHSWFDAVSSTSAGLIGCDHPETEDSCTGTATEEYAYLAIDPTLQDLETAEVGTQSISSSNFEPITFTSSYTTPQLLVMQNSDNGGQDPQYPWARNVLSTGADIRYCEADAGGVCDGHAAETVRWLSIEDGSISVLNASSWTTSTSMSPGDSIEVRL
ncbi:MAG: hypothetical protein ACLFPL_05700, partial [Candidatus Nanoarchaeia archaeon]